MRTTIRTTYIDKDGVQLTKEQVDKKYIKIKCHREAKKVGWVLQIIYIWECEPNNQLTLKL